MRPFMNNRFTIITILISALFLFSCVSNSTEPDDSISLRALGRATSEGNQWKQLVQLPTKIEKVNFWLSDITCSIDGYVYVSTSGGGIYKINPKDTSYVQLTNGLIVQQNEGFGQSCFSGSVLCLGNRVVCSSSHDNLGGYFYSGDGNTFKQTAIWNKGAYGESIAQSPNGQLFAAGYGQVLRSTNFGKSWIDESLNFDSGLKNFFSIAFDKNAGIYVTANKGLYYSDDKQIQFKRIAFENEDTYGIDVNSEGWIFVTAISGLYCSKDEGKNWALVSTFPIKISYGSVYINKNNAIFVGCGNGVYRSNDNGLTWVLVGLKGMNVGNIKSDNNGNLLAYTWGNRVYLGTN